MTEKVLHEFTAKNGAKFRVRESREPNGMSVIEEIGSDGYWGDVRPTQLPSALHESIWVSETLRLSDELSRARAEGRLEGMREIARGLFNFDTPEDAESWAADLIVAAERELKGDGG